MWNQNTFNSFATSPTVIPESHQHSDKLLNRSTVSMPLRFLDSRSISSNIHILPLYLALMGWISLTALALNWNCQWWPAQISCDSHHWPFSHREHRAQAVVLGMWGRDNCNRGAKGKCVGHSTGHSGVRKRKKKTPPPQLLLIQWVKLPRCLEYLSYVLRVTRHTKL